MYLSSVSLGRFALKHDFVRAPCGPARSPFLDTIAPGMLKRQARAGFTFGQ